MTRRGWAMFAAMCVIWGIPYLLIKVAVRSLDPTVLVLARTGIAALLLLPVAAARGALRPLLAHWRAVLAFTAAEVALPWLALSEAETRLSSSLSGLLVAAVPLVGAVLAQVTGAPDRLDRRRLAGLLVGFAGVVALLGLDLRGGDLRAAAEMGVVVVGYATGPMIVDRRLSRLPSVGVTAVALTVAAAVYAPAGLTRLPARVPSASVLAAVAVLAVVCTALAFLLFFELIREIGPQRGTVITYVNPAVAVALGVTVLGEPFGLGTALGFVLILAGCALATRRPGAGPAVSAGEPVGDLRTAPTNAAR